MLSVVFAAGAENCVLPFDYFLLGQTLEAVAQIRHMLLLLLLLERARRLVRWMRAHSELQQVLREGACAPVHKHIEAVLDFKLSHHEVRPHYASSAGRLLAYPTLRPLVVRQTDQEGPVIEHLAFNLPGVAGE